MAYCLTSYYCAQQFLDRLVAPPASLNQYLGVVKFWSSQDQFMIVIIQHLAHFYARPVFDDCKFGKYGSFSLVCHAAVMRPSDLLRGMSKVQRPRLAFFWSVAKLIAEMRKHMACRVGRER